MWNFGILVRSCDLALPFAIVLPIWDDFTRSGWQPRVTLRWVRKAAAGFTYQQQNGYEMLSRVGTLAFLDDLEVRWWSTDPCDNPNEFNQGGIRRVKHFSCKFLHKMVLVKYPCAFRPRRLTQNAGRGRRVRHFPSNFRDKMVSVTCPWSRRFCADIVKSLVESLRRDFVQRGDMEIWYRDLGKRFPDILPKRVF